MAVTFTKEQINTLQNRLDDYLTKVTIQDAEIELLNEKLEVAIQAMQSAEWAYLNGHTHNSPAKILCEARAYIENLKSNEPSKKGAL